MRLYFITYSCYSTIQPDAGSNLILHNYYNSSYVDRLCVLGKGASAPKAPPLNPCLSIDSCSSIWLISWSNKTIAESTSPIGYTHDLNAKKNANGGVSLSDAYLGFG